MFSLRFVKFWTRQESSSVPLLLPAWRTTILVHRVGPARTVCGWLYFLTEKALKISRRMLWEKHVGLWVVRKQFNFRHAKLTIPGKFGPDTCGTNGQSPNEKCWSHCDAHAEVSFLLVELFRSNATQVRTLRQSCRYQMSPQCLL